MTKTEHTLLLQALRGIEEATVPFFLHGAHAVLSIGGSGRSSVHIFGGDPDEYQPQGTSLDPIEVEVVASTATIIVRARDGEDIDELLDRALDFVSTETPVPA